MVPVDMVATAEAITLISRTLAHNFHLPGPARKILQNILWRFEQELLAYLTQPHD